MRERERFVLTAISLGFFLWIIQLIPISWRYLGIAGFTLLTYLTSAWTLRKYLKFHHWLIFLPFPALYSLFIGCFYFLLPTNFWSMITVLGLFSLGMYALFLCGNIFCVAEHDKKIQLTRAAQNIILFFAIIISLLGCQVIYSFAWPVYLSFLAVFGLHLLLTLTVAWSVELNRISLELFQLSFFGTLLIAECALILSFLPIEPWRIALLIMSTFYLILGILQVFIGEKLYRRALGEYTLLMIVIILMYIAIFPGK
ncbi:hypothetical protein IJJ08_00785 [bacterium]|nr:hypothetical protein [bacterium]